MNDLSQSLTKLNNASKLLVVRGSPYTVLPQLFKDWKITHLVYETVSGLVFSVTSAPTNRL